MLLGLKSIFNQIIHHNAYLQEPSRRFEKITGISGLSGDYVFPDGMSGIEFENACQRYIDTVESDAYQPPKFLSQAPEIEDHKIEPPHRRIIFHSWEMLKKLNPDLCKLPVQSDIDHMYAVSGIVSGFNMDDIELFLTLKQDGKSPFIDSLQVLDVKAMREKIERKTFTRLNWVCSPKTLEKITLHLE